MYRWHDLQPTPVNGKPDHFPGRCLICYHRSFYLAAGVGDLNSETADSKVDAVQNVDYCDAVVAAATARH